MIDPQIFATLTASLIVASVVWGLRLEGRVNTTQQQIVDKEKFDNARNEAMKELLETKFDSVDDRLERIERALNGSMGRGHK